VPINGNTRKPELEIKTDRSSQTRQYPGVNRYRSGFGLPKCSRSDSWMVRKQNQPVFVFPNWTTDNSPGYVANTNPQLYWRRTGPGSPAPDQLRQPTPELTSSPPGMTPVQHGDNRPSPGFHMDSVLPGCVYIRAPVPNAEWFYLAEYAKYSMNNNDFYPDLLPDKGTFTC